jgi:hypothetical protein
MATVSAARFALALKKLTKPGGRQLRFLRAHYKAPGRALTARRLAQAVGYKSYRGINLWYGRLAARIGPMVGNPGAGMLILVEFAPPKSLTNKEWILVMRPEFAQGLRLAGWV